MPTKDPSRSHEIRVTLEKHVAKRRLNALERVTGTDSAAIKRRGEIEQFLQLQPLLNGCLNLIGQVQIASHINKAIHPDLRIRNSTNLLVWPSQMQKHSLVGSYLLTDDLDLDATGNGAVNKKVHEVFLLLQVTFDGERVLSLLKRGDPDAIQALGTDEVEARAVASAVVRIDVACCPRLASHTQAKQVYWLVGDDPHSNDSYHLLAPLYPTSLVHRLYQSLQDDRFSEGAKAAREARKSDTWSERPVREYKDLAIQTLGGTKPQNISQLNSERRGDNCLLASLPPLWQSADIKPLLGTDSLFKPFARRSEVRALLKHLREYLDLDPRNNLATRAHRDEIVDALLDEFMQFSAELQTLEPGWSAGPTCDLPALHCAWLDPDGAQAPAPDLVDDMAVAFAQWLNARLREPMLMGDAELAHWQGLAREMFKEAEREGAL